MSNMGVVILAVWILGWIVGPKYLQYKRRLGSDLKNKSMTEKENKTANPFPFLKQVEELPREVADQIADAMIAHMEATQPKIWFIFLYEQGMSSVLSQFFAESPFGQVSPADRAIERDIRQLYPDLSVWQASQVEKVIQCKVTDDLISKHFEFNPPKS